MVFFMRVQEAWGYTAEVSEYRKSSHAVYRLRYHFVFITKYRKPALRGEIGKGCGIWRVCRSWRDLKGHVRPGAFVVGCAAEIGVAGEGKRRTSTASHKLRKDDIFGHEGTSWRRLGM